jgi:hypothetical protein
MMVAMVSAALNLGGGDATTRSYSVNSRFVERLAAGIGRRSGVQLVTYCFGADHRPCAPARRADEPFGN